MATLAPSLRNLFTELDIRWPHRDRRTDGWIGDKAHRATQSDHNPDSRGIVHAIDIDKDGIDVNVVISAAIRDDRPTSYVVHNRLIWSRSRDWEPKEYKGKNPHTSHIHVSIQYGTKWEGSNWHWRIVDLGAPPDVIVPIGQAEEMDDWSAYFTRSAGAYADISFATAHAVNSLNSLLR